MVLARLKILILKVRITVFLVTIALMRMKHGCMGIGFIQQNMVMEERLQTGPQQTILNDS